AERACYLTKNAAGFRPPRLVILLAVVNQGCGGVTGFTTGGFGRWPIISPPFTLSPPVGAGKNDARPKYASISATSDPAMMNRLEIIDHADALFGAGATAPGAGGKREGISWRKYAFSS